MALSGSFTNMPSKYLGLYCTWSAKQSVIGNYSNVTLNVYLKYYALTVGVRTDSKISINGTSETFTVPSISQSSMTSHTTLLKSKTVKVIHNSNGTKNDVALSASWRFDGTYSGTSIGTITASTTVDLNAIDRTAPTVTLKTSNVTANGFSISAVSTATVDIWEYEIGSGWVSLTSTTSTSASKAITGLSPNTSYTVKVRARKKSNAVYGYASEKVVKTLGGAVLSSVSTMTADSSTAKINFGATVYDSSYKYTLKIKNGSTEYLSISNITLAKGTANRTVTLTSTQRNALLSKMTNIKSFTATFQLLTYSGTTQIGTTSSKTATVQTTSSNSSPIFSNEQYTSFDYMDCNDSTIAITGSNKYLIQNHSILEVNPHQMTARNGATIKSYTVSCNGMTKSNTSGVTMEIGKITKSGKIDIEVKVTDSRGYTKTTSKEINVIAYAIPKITSATLRRTNEIESEMQLVFKGSFSAITVGTAKKNSLKYVRYRYKKTSSSSYSSYVSILADVSVSSTNFSFSDLELCTLDSNYSYDFHLQIIDKLDSVDWYFTVPQGTPLVSLRGKKVGVNNPNPTVALDVKGSAKVDGGEVWHGGNLQIQVGRYNFENVEANVAQIVDITFDIPFDVTPTITCSAYSIVPEMCNVGVSSATKTGFKLSFTRTTAVSTGVFWQAIAIV